MKKFSEIVRNALDEADAQTKTQLPEGVRKTDNGDGTVTLEFTIDVDPAVAAEKGAAMPKGQKREDLSDVVDPEEDVVAEDAAPATGGASRHDTPLENCRAVDPMFCPYHGAQAIKKSIESYFMSNNPIAMANLKISVEKKNKGSYSVKITTASTDTATSYASMINLGIVNGFNLGACKSNTNGNGTQTIEKEVDTDVPGIGPSKSESRRAMLDEWTDTLLDEFANNQNAQIDADDLADMLQLQQDMDDLAANPTGNQKADDKAMNDKFREFERQYHAIRAQTEMSHVATPADATAEQQKIESRKTKDDYGKMLAEMNGVCAKLGIRKGTRAASYPWSGRSEYNARSTRSYLAQCGLADSAKNLSNAISANDMKAARAALHNMDYAMTEYNDAVKSFKDSFDSQMAEAKNYAAQQGVALDQAVSEDGIGGMPLGWGMRGNYGKPPSLWDHDIVYHHGHYDGGRCKMRDGLKKKDEVDVLPLITSARHGMSSASDPKRLLDLDVDAVKKACSDLGVRYPNAGKVQSGRWKGFGASRLKYAVSESGTGLFASGRPNIDGFAVARPEEAMTFSSKADADAVAQAANKIPGRSFKVVESKSAVVRGTERPSKTISFPETLDESDLKGFMTTLNGSTKPYIGTINGQTFVLKRGSHTSDDHVENEHIANELHLAAGLRAPRSRIYKMPSGEKVMLAEYIPGCVALDQAWASADGASKKKIREQVLEAYPFESFLAGIDVFQNDNAIVDQDDNVWFVDNGASFDFRATGGRKGWFNDRKSIDDAETGLMSMYNHKNQTLVRGIIGETNLTEVLGKASKYDFTSLVKKLPKSYRTRSLVDYAKNLDALSSVCSYPDSVNARLEKKTGDITKEKVDAIVNAANTYMLGGGGVDGAIHRAAGPDLVKECATFPILDDVGTRCEVGDAKTTKGYDLPAKFVIHTVGPDVRDGMTADAPAKLASAYRRSLEEAARVGAKSVAFPSISTGIYAFPKQEADAIAEKTVKDFLSSHPDMKVKFLSFTPPAPKTASFDPMKIVSGALEDIGGSNYFQDDLPF